MLKLENINKRYGKQEILDNFCLELEEGDFFGFIGGNGVGKTTLLKIAACLLKPDSGEVYVDGINGMRHPYQARNHIGYVPDHFGLYDSLTVEEYMEFYAETYGLDGMKAKYLCMDILTGMHLEEYTNVFVDTLSRGMKQRLCMARALIHNPNILILDEPFSGIDNELRREMNELCRDMARNGKIVMFSSHQLSDIEQICNKVGVLKNGHLEICMNVDEITSHEQISQEIEIHVSDRLEDCKNLLRGETAVLSVSSDRERNTITVRGHFTEEEMTGILKKLISKDIPVVSYHRKDAPVEQLFEMVSSQKRRIM